MSLTCDEMPDLIVQSVITRDGLSEERAAAVREHLSGCENCRHKEENLRAALEETSMPTEEETAWALRVLQRVAVEQN